MTKVGRTILPVARLPNDELLHRLPSLSVFVYRAPLRTPLSGVVTLLRSLPLAVSSAASLARVPTVLGPIRRSDRLSSRRLAEAVGRPPSANSVSTGRVVGLLAMARSFLAPSSRPRRPLDDQAPVLPALTAIGTQGGLRGRRKLAARRQPGSDSRMVASSRRNCACNARQRPSLGASEGREREDRCRAD